MSTFLQRARKVGRADIVNTGDSWALVRHCDSCSQRFLLVDLTVCSHCHVIAKCTKCVTFEHCMTCSQSVCCETHCPGCQRTKACDQRCCTECARPTPVDIDEPGSDV